MSRLDAVRKIGLVSAVLAGTTWAQLTQRVSLDSGGVQGTGNSFAPSITADGRFVAFNSQAANLVAGDTNGFFDVFVRDRQTGITERVSVSTAGTQGDGDSSFGYTPSISADGRFVAFSSLATNLVANDTNGFADVFVRDRLSGTTERVSVATGGAAGNANSLTPSISADGRYVAFESFASNLVGSDSNGTWDVFVRDRQAGTTERASVDSSGSQANGGSHWAAISASGGHERLRRYLRARPPERDDGASERRLEWSPRQRHGVRALDLVGRTLRGIL